jgi:hypothetical protein
VKPKTKKCKTQPRVTGASVPAPAGETAFCSFEEEEFFENEPNTLYAAVDTIANPLPAASAPVEVGIEIG